jgi:hypothetical protein
MRAPVYMKPKVKWREAGVNGGNGKFKVGRSSPGSCLVEDCQERQSRDRYKTMRRGYSHGHILVTG